MSIINFNSVAQTDLQQKQAVVRDKITKDINDVLRMMLDTYNRDMQLVWANSSGLTPQQVLDGFGKDAQQLFFLAGLLEKTVNATANGTIPQQTLPPLTMNADGSVTILPPPAPPAPPVVDPVVDASSSSDSSSSSSDTSVAVP